jgi:uncharacterized oxidoreductase
MVRVDAGELESFAARLIEAFGSPPRIAGSVAESLVAADLRGHGSHGVRRLATLYPRMIDGGDLDPAAEPTVDREGPTAAKVDGHRGWGHYTGRRAADLAIEKATDGPVAAVGVRNGAHMGRIGEFAERAAEAGIVLCAYVNTGGAGETMAVPGTTGRDVAVNPYAVGVPTFDALPFPIVLDMATGQVAHGKIMKRALAGKPLPDDWAIDDDGTPLTDAEAFEDGVGAILPLGGAQTGHKGAALSLATELLAGLIGDHAVFGEDEFDMVNNGAAFLAVDPEWFLSRDACRERVGALADHLRSLDYDPELVTPPGKTDDHPVLPGESEHDLRRDREAKGIPMDEGAIGHLSDVADEHGVDERPAAFGDAR